MLEGTQHEDDLANLESFELPHFGFGNLIGPSL